MRFNKLDLNLLVALDALLAERNITRAAQRLNLSQSAMSNALGRLREHLGDELLVQVGRKMELTPRAEALQEVVRDVLVRIDVSIAAPPAFDSTTSEREFTILLSDYTMTLLMPHVLALASRQGSTVRFRFVPQVTSPARALERGEADLLVIPRAYCSPEHPTEALFTEDFVCAVWRESSHARHGLTFEQYAAAGHVVMPVLDMDQPPVENRFVQHHGLSRRIAASCFTFSAMLHLIVGTEYVATVHSRLARRQLPSLPLVLLPAPLSVPVFEQVMQWHTYRTLDPGLVWLRRLMLEASAAMTSDPTLEARGG